MDASYRLPSPHAGVELRLRGAAGIAPLVTPGWTYLAPSPDPYRLLEPREFVSRQVEREGGFDADFGTRAHVELTWFRYQTRQAIIGTDQLSLSGFPLSLPLLADVSNSGVEGMLSAQLFRGARVGWRGTLTAATLHGNLDRPEGRYRRSFNGSLDAGYPLQGYSSNGYQWACANADGLIAISEVGPEQTWNTRAVETDAGDGAAQRRDASSRHQHRRAARLSSRPVS